MSSYRIENGRCEHRTNPLGIDAAQPRLTWAYYGKNPDHLGGEIRVVTAKDADFSEIMWDSGWIESDLTAMLCEGPARFTGQRVWWKARTRLKGRPETEAVSEAYWFEMGLLEASDWHGGWIRADSDFEAPVMLRSVRLDAPPRRARAYVCGLGVFELYVNGLRVGDEVMQPVLTAYSRQPLTGMLYPYEYGGVYRTPYRTFDLAPYLRVGENEIEVHLGNGWYHQNQRLVEGNLWFGDSPVLRMEMRFDDRVVATDADWRWREGCVVRNNLFYGEEADFTRAPGAARPVMCAKAPDGELRAQVCPSDAVVAEYPLHRALAAKEDRLILDFAQNLSGWVALKVNARRGDRLELRFAEEIEPDGDVWKLDFASAGGENQIQADAFTFAGTADECARPRFCWHGFRYAEVRLLRGGETVALSCRDGKLVADGFCAEAKSEFVATHQAVTGSFECDNDLLNWFHQTTILSLRSNEHCGVPLDCPHRERLGYTGDGQLVTPVTLMNLDSAAMIEKWLDDILDAQHRETGHVPHTVPFYNGGGGPGGWGGAMVFVPWALYRHTGDARILRRAWPQMMHWMDYLESRSEDGIVVREQDGGWCLGDWCMPGNTKNVKIEPALVNTAMTIKMLGELAQMADVLNLADEKARLLSQKEARCAAFRRAFWHEETASFGAGCQGATAMALWADAVPEEDRARVVQRVVDEVEAADRHFDTGIFATPILLEVLSENGRSDLAYALMTAEGYPSFEHMRANGATTLHENWALIGESHNHQMFGAADEWLYAWVAGISQAKDSFGWRKIDVRPGLVPGVNRARASIETPLGRVAISWNRTPSGLDVQLEHPAFMTAVVS